MLTGRLQALKNIALAVRPRGIIDRIVDGIGFPPYFISGFQGFKLRLLRALAAKGRVAGPPGDQVERLDEARDDFGPARHSLSSTPFLRNTTALSGKVVWKVWTRSISPNR